MAHLVISVVNRPSACPPYSDIRIALQTKNGYEGEVNDVFSTQLRRKTNRKGEENWDGNAVQFHGDGRRFIYLAWIGLKEEEWEMFRRIKLYVDQITELDPALPDQEVRVTINGRGKDGGPATSTAQLIDGD